MSAAYCRFAPGDPVHGLYHDTEYGFPTEDEGVLFERLMLEINQAGLSWATILKKRAAFRAAFADFAVDRVAAFGAAEIERLLADPGIIRNRLKIEAAIENARRIQALRRSHGSFALLARGAPPALAGSMDAALPPDLSLYRGPDRRRIPDECGLSARRPRTRLPGLCPDPPTDAAVGAADLTEPVPRLTRFSRVKSRQV